MRTFIPHIDLEDMNKWLIANGKGPLTVDDVPSNGMIQDGVGCGFFVTTDTRVCFIECLVTNPNAESSDRNVFIDKLVVWATELGKERGYSTCGFITRDRELFNRGKRHGFEFKEVIVAMKTL